MLRNSVAVRHPYLYRDLGFTLLELLVTIAIAAILAALAAPSVRDFIVRNKMSSIGNEFSGGLQRARNEAVSKNTCVTMCMSSTVDDDDPVCATSGSDWQIGWIAFLDPSCANPAKPAERIDLLFTRKGEAGDYHLYVNGETPIQSIEFGARGINGLGNARRFDVMLKDGENVETKKFGFNICLNALGRTRNVRAGEEC
jgi:type IV fimbrial biogenesis protein FimT